MSRVALIGDLHWGTRNGDINFMNFQLDYFRRFVEKAKSMGCTRVIQLGDWFDVRKNTNNLLIMHLCTTVPDIIKGSGMEWIKVRGNHECFYRENNSVGADILLDHLSGVMVVDHYHEFDGMAFCGWMNKNNSDSILGLLAASKAKYCFGHFEPAGFPMYRNTPLSTHGLDISVLSKFEGVFSGHYHTVSQQKNFLMCGSPYHLTWSDYPDGDDRGWFILDTETDSVEFIKNGPEDTLFAVFHYDPEFKYQDDSLSQYEGKIVKIVIDAKPDARHFKKFKNIVDGTQFIDYAVIDNTIVERKEVQVDMKQLEVDTLGVLHKYIAAQEGVDHSAVSVLASDIYNRAVGG